MSASQRRAFEGDVYHSQTKRQAETYNQNRTVRLQSDETSHWPNTAIIYKNGSMRIYHMFSPSLLYPSQPNTIQTSPSTDVFDHLTALAAGANPKKFNHVLGLHTVQCLANILSDVEKRMEVAQRRWKSHHKMEILQTSERLSPKHIFTLTSYLWQN